MQTEIKGYAGKFLRVDLTKGTLEDWIWDEEAYRSYLGGTGAGARVLYDEVPLNANWSDPENRMVIASGPLGGTSVGGTGTISLVTKGALTGGATSVQANGLFGAYMKFSGFDGLVIQGASDKWTYLMLKDGTAELRDASEIMGLDTYEVSNALKEIHNARGRDAAVLSIGPAGENLIRWAGVFVDKGHSASHNGTGAVLGCKKLKAIIAFPGSRKINVHDPRTLKKVAQEMYEEVEYFKGTIGGVETNQKAENSTLPVKNYTTNLWDISDEKIDAYGEMYLRDTYQVGREPCWGCRLLHCAWMEVKTGPYAGIVEEPEYEQLAAWGPAIGVDDVEASFMLSGLTDRLGLENNEAGWITGWLMECFEKGWITEEQSGGFKIAWGDVWAVVELLEMISKREGFGLLLAEGIKRASEKIGGLAADAAIYTMKGNIPRGHDHRTRWAEMFDTCVSSTSTIETHMSMMGPDAQGPGNWKVVSTEVAETKGLMQLDDSTGACRFNTGMNAKNLAAAISSATGWDFTGEEGRRVGLRAINLMRAYNLRAGIGAEYDRPSVRYGSTPVDGLTSGISILPHWNDMLTNYYTLMGWDPATGIPLPETLEGLGIGYVNSDLEELR
ncbi:MAG: aldehyde ferredoxin oxidoreductase C-terminal domain-containing protein [Candidatus Bathyarchaeota archaeon]|nr:aldehyde ferredoxin oxidoreductase C-terminal domain-containing protein [Candidatus Bathyarchaeota archaeon]